MLDMNAPHGTMVSYSTKSHIWDGGPGVFSIRISGIYVWREKPIVFPMRKVIHSHSRWFPHLCWFTWRYKFRRCKKKYDLSLQWILEEYEMFCLRICRGTHWRFPEMGIAQNGWFVMQSPIKYGWCGGIPILGNHQFRNENRSLFLNELSLQVGTAEEATRCAPPCRWPSRNLVACPAQCFTSVPGGFLKWGYP